MQNTEDGKDLSKQGVAWENEDNPKEEGLEA